MTGADWLACDDPRELLRHLGKTAEGRKCILFCCACARRVWQSLVDQRSRAAVATAEAFADGLATGRELTAAAEQADEAVRDAKRRADSPTGGRRRFGDYLAEAAAHASHAASYAVRVCLGMTPYVQPGLAATAAANVARYLCADRTDPDGAAAGTPNSIEPRAAKGAEEGTQAAILRCIFANPFQPAAVDPARQTPAVGSLAQAAYDERILPSGELESARLAVLADALEDAGCTDDAILSHLRSPGPHVRGCWALDLVLGKS
jgi:hypothetical protein